jgi:hypothetical protein
MPKPTLSLFLFLTFILLVPFVHGQALKTIEKEVLSAFDQRNYSEALSQAELLLSLDSQRVDALFISGESAMYLGAFELAETYFKRIPDEAKLGLYAVTDLRLAEVRMRLGKCDDARRSFEKYRTVFARKADIFLQQIEDELMGCGMVEAPKDKVEVIQMKINRLGNNVNTDRFEISPLLYADKLYFTSIIPGGKNGQGIARIFTSVRDEAPRPFQGNPKENNVHAINTTLTPDAGRIFYSLCDGEAPDNFIKCSIWYRDRTYEGGWGPLKKLPSNINMTGYTACQPNIGYDKSLKKEVLFFVSDRPGSAGKLDIWCCTVERDGSFGQPFNLPINTPDDDVTPYFDNSTQTLFFSSNNPESRGGFDVFQAEKAATGEWTKPRNMDAPLNSAFDDLYFTFHNGTNMGYFSSNRPTEQCPDSAASCRNFDIYQLKIFANLEVSVFHAADSSDLYKSTIELMDLATGNIDTTCLKIAGNSSNLHLDLGKSYRLIVSREGFFPFFTDISTNRINHPASLEEQVYLRSMSPNPAPFKADKGPDKD